MSGPIFFFLLFFCVCVCLGQNRREKQSGRQSRRGEEERDPISIGDERTIVRWYDCGIV